MIRALTITASLYRLAASKERTLRVLRGTVFDDGGAEVELTHRGDCCVSPKRLVVSSRARGGPGAHLLSVA